MGAPASWDDAVAQAKKIMGNKADIPKPKNDEDKLFDRFSKAYAEFRKAADVVEAALLAHEQALNHFVLSEKQNAAQYENADFGLDERSKEDIQKIKKAQKVFSDYFNSVQSNLAHAIKVLDELDKHYIQIDKYKPSLPTK